MRNTTYTPTTLLNEQTLNNHKSALCSFGISTKGEEPNLPSLYYVYKRHKCIGKRRSTFMYCWVCQMLHRTFFKIISIYDIGGQNRASELLWYCYPMVGGCMNQVWILQHSKYLLEFINQCRTPRVIALKHLTFLPCLHNFSLH